MRERVGHPRKPAAYPGRSRLRGGCRCRARALWSCARPRRGGRLRAPVSRAPTGSSLLLATHLGGGRTVFDVPAPDRTVSETRRDRRRGAAHQRLEPPAPGAASISRAGLETRATHHLSVIRRGEPRRRQPPQNLRTIAEHPAAAPSSAERREQRDGRRRGRRFGWSACSRSPDDERRGGATLDKDVASNARAQGRGTVRLAHQHGASSSRRVTRYAQRRGASRRSGRAADGSSTRDVFDVLAVAAPRVSRDARAGRAPTVVGRPTCADRYRARSGVVFRDGDLHAAR